MMILTLILAAMLELVPGGDATLQQMQKRDSILIADQMRYGLTLKDVQKGTGIALPDLGGLSNDTLTIVGNWQLDTLVRGRTIHSRNAKEAGLDGVVCSPLEAGMVKAACGSGFLAVTPGIRFADAAADDQVRITTPARAREIGSDYIVVGRPITAAPDPIAAYERCLAEFVNQ